jgi:hypothetical protein
LFITTLVHVATNEFIWVAQREKLIDNKPWNFCKCNWWEYANDPIDSHVETEVMGTIHIVWPQKTHLVAMAKSR